MRKSILHSRRGFALMVTLWVLVLLSVLAVDFAMSSRYGSAGARNFKEETIAYYSALSAFEEATAYLSVDKDTALDYLDEEGEFWTDDRPPFAPSPREGVDIQVSIIDEDSRLNINTLNDLGFKKLFSHAGIPDDTAEELTDAVFDWKDPDDLHRLSGAESDYYETLDTPYKAKNRTFDVPEELLLVKGFRPEYLYGSKDINGIYPLITTFSSGININTASPDVMSFVGFGDLDIEAIMRLRTEENGGVRVVPPELLKLGAPISIGSSCYRVEVTARGQESANTVKITAVLRKVPGQKGTELKTIYWRETVESGGA